jgi:hypothetical protein
VEGAGVENNNVESNEIPYDWASAEGSMPPAYFVLLRW